MLYGVAIFATDYAMPPEALARAAEERGFESLWLPEHTHIPANRRSPWPGGKDLPREYWHTYDLFVALTAAAMATTRLRVATGICLVVERDPIITAKEVASLDRLSGGRLLFGIGGGWNAEEMENHGTKFTTRWRLLRERVLAMKAIWTQEEAEFHGEFVNFDKIWSYPKPVQVPHPPVLMGGDGPTTFDRVSEYCDGWMPIAGRLRGPVAERVAALRRHAGQAGRDPGSLPVTIWGAQPEPRPIEEMARAGADRAVFVLPCAGREAVLPHLDSWAALVRKG